MLENIGYAEIDKTASAIYRYHWPEHNNLGDATAIVCNDLADFDFLIAGFPCQSFSIAGKRQGFNEARGTLFFEIARILSHKRPRHFLLENVKGLLSSNDGKDFPAILRILSDLNYRVETVVLNSKHYGVPQNRERVFFIGHLGDECEREILSFGEGDGGIDAIQRASGRERQWLSVDTESPERDTASIESWRDGRERYGDNGIMQLNDPTHSNNRVYAEGGTRQPFVAIPVLTPARPTKRQNGRRFKAEGDDAFTLTAQDQHGVMVQMETANYVTPDAYLTRGERNRDENGNSVLTSMADRRIRRLTPIECERLQGCPDGFTKYGRYGDEIKEMSDTARYKGLGNSFTVNVIEAIVTRMIEKGCLK